MHDGDGTTEPEFTIFTMPDLLRQKYRELHGRMTDVVAFELPITDRAIEELLEAEGAGYQLGQEMPSYSVPAEVHAAVTEAAPEGAGVRYYDADSGRGASGYAIALELTGYVANVGGAATAIWVTAKGVRRLYESLRRKLGHRPLISLGTAVYLAAADLSERIGTAEFALYGAGDARSQVLDAAYSGSDLFYIFFEKDRTLHSYIVDARGRVHYQGTLLMRDMRDELP
jgi:hypothetical protein